VQNNKGICERIIKLDRNIRFVGIVNDRGEVIEGGFQRGIQPMLGETEEQQMYINSLTFISAFDLYKEKLGALKSSVSEHQKVTLITIPLGDGRILCISCAPKGKVDKIKAAAAGVIKESHLGAKTGRNAKKSMK